MTRSRHSSTIVAAAIVALMLSACSSNQGGASDRGGVPAQPAPGQPALPLPGEPLAEPGSERSDPDAPGAGVERSVIVTASISLSDPAPIDVADEVQELAEASGGRVDRRNDSPGGVSDPAWSELVLRIPSDELDTAVGDISELATVVTSSIDRQDVTGSVADVDARIGALDASIERLLSLLGSAASTSDLITIESELTARQAERDGLAAQQASLADQVEFATITVRIGVPGEVGEAGPGDFRGGLVLGFASLGAFLSGLAVALGVLVPWAVLLGVIAAVVWWAVRGRRARGGHDPRPSVSGAGPVVPPAPTAPAPAAATPAMPGTVPAAPPLPPRPPLPTSAAPAAPDATSTPATPATATPRKPAARKKPTTGQTTPRASSGQKKPSTPRQKDEE